MRWRRTARLVLGIFAVAFAVWVAFAFRRREPASAPPPSVSQTDPKAVVESTGGRLIRYTGTHEDVTVDFEKQLTYPDGATRLAGVTVRARPKNGSRTFLITGKEGHVGENQSTIVLDGDVRLTASDGLTAATEHATYADHDATVHAPGAASFTQGRLNGSGVGLTYDKNKDALTIAERAVVNQAAGESGGGAMAITAGGATIARQDGFIKFERGLNVTRGTEQIQADNGVATLSADRKHIQSVDLHGGARLGNTAKSKGGLESLTARDMTLRYGPGGDVLEHVTAIGDSAIQLAGEAGRPGRKITANTVDVALAQDGATPTAVVAQDAVRVALPASVPAMTRTMTADSFSGTGESGRGLTRGHFSGNVRYREEGGPNGFRGVNAALADITFTPGSDDIDSAEFVRGVHVDTEKMGASASLVRYVPREDALELSGSESGQRVPHVVTEQITIDARTIGVTLTGPKVKASGDVKSVLQNKSADSTGQKTDTKLPSMLKQDQPVNVTSADLSYDGSASRAAYTGAAQLWQGETTVKGAAITIDDKSGDLSATGSVATTTIFEQENKDKKKEHVRSVATSKEFKYEETPRRAVYTGDVHMTGPQGNITAARVELFLKPSGDELDRAEAYDSVTIREPERTTTGARMTYLADKEHYVVTGTPVKVVDSCGRETIGKTLNFDKAADTIVVDGNERNRTESKGGSGCK